MTYLKWHEKTITDFSDKNINTLYNEGYLFGRTGKGDMYQTRSLRIDLAKFKLSSENRRVLKKTENIQIEKHPLPLPLLGEGRGMGYHWSIGKMGKNFYDTKCGEKTFSANKIKELMTDPKKSNFNVVLAYSLAPSPHQGEARWGLPSFKLPRATNPVTLAQTTATLPNPPLSSRGGSALGGEREGNQPIGYCIALETPQLLHYCYPFYRLLATSYKLPANTGLGMMLKAILWAQANGKKYVYLGSFSRPTDTYKLQFEGLEWWDGKEWKNDLEELNISYSRLNYETKSN